MAILLSSRGWPTKKKKRKRKRRERVGMEGDGGLCMYVCTVLYGANGDCY